MGSLLSAQPATPVLRRALAQSPQLPGVQAQQPVAVNTGATAQVPQPVPVPNDREKKLEEMVALLVKQGMSEQQIKQRVGELDKQKFFDKPKPTSPEATAASFKGKPVGLLADKKESDKEEEKPKGILGV